MATGNWIPGLSDIDLSVILKSGLSDEQEFALVDALRMRYRRLKRLFPMLGELEILGEEDLPAWLYRTADSPQGRAWTLLHGHASADLTSDGSPIWHPRALNVALCIYIDMLPPCASKPDSFLRRQDAARRVRKILRQLTPILREHGLPAFEPQSWADGPDLIAGAATALENAVACLDSAIASAGLEPGWFSPAENRCRFQRPSAAGFEAVRSGIVHRGRVILVINAGLGGAVIARVAEAARERWTEPVVLLPENVFRYFVRHYNPYEYARLFRDRNILFGSDPLDGAPPPGRSEFAASTLGQTGNLLAFTRGEELFSGSGMRFSSDLEIAVRRMMALRLLLEDGWVSPDCDEIEARWRRRFPESAQVLERIRIDTEVGRREPATRAAFSLFRSFATEIREAAGTEMSAVPSVSVVVPAYNSARTVAETIASLLALDYPRELLELIFVNNASSDDTAEILQQHLNRIRVIYEPRRGRSPARNAGLRVARYSVVAFIDADCSADPQWLRQIVTPLENPRVGIVGGRILAARPCNPIEEFGEWLHDHERSICTFQPPYAITPNWASRRSVLLDAGGFDNALARGEDCDLSYRILQAGYGVDYQHSAVVFQRNKANLKELFREGFDDGYHGVQVVKKHRDFVRKCGHRHISPGKYGRLLTNVARIASGRGAPHTHFETVFTCGKIGGKICGSLRFGCIEL